MSTQIIMEISLSMRTAPFLAFLIVFLTWPSSVGAQTDLHISGPKAGFPIAIPSLCDRGGSADAASKIAEVMSRDLQLVGMFNVLNPSTFVEAPGKCGENVAFSDWSVIGAEGLVKGEVVQSNDGRSIEAKLFLYDVQQQRAVVGKQYQASAEDMNRIAHRFANEIMLFFTGEKGVFGTRIAYVSRVGRFKELFIMDFDGANNKQLTNDRGLALSPSWSPSGDRLIYTSYRTKRPDLYFISPDGGAPKAVTSNDSLELGAKFAPDGSRIIASTSINGVANLSMLDFRGNIIAPLTRGGAIDVSPSFSPDGSQVVFCSNRGGGPQIYVMPSSGGTARRISYTSSNYCTSPVWSPKGDKIAFICRSGGNQVFLTTPEAQQTVQLTYQGNNEDPSWSPDGRYVAFSTDAFGGGRTLGLMSMVNPSPIRLSVARGENSQPAWSPRIE